MASSGRTRVLVLDGDMVPALAIARSLSRRRCLVDVASHMGRPLSSYSRAVRSHIPCPDPLADPQGFLRWVAEAGDSRHYELVIPVTERTLLPMSGARHQLRGVRVAMPAADSVERVLDKAGTLALAAEVGVPGPGGIHICSLAELEGKISTLQFPIVLKPARSIGSGSEGPSQLQVSYAFSAEELWAGCRHALRYGTVLLQEYFSGAGVGVELIARQGEIQYAFQHRRLHEVPLTGGGSSLRLSEPVNGDLLQASARLMAALRWHGVAMVEFKVNPESGEYRLMEINGRFWGSLPLATAAGADFPAMLLDLELDGEVRPLPPYRNGISCRLLSRDLTWYEAVLRGETDQRLVPLPGRGQAIRDLLLMFSPRHHFDVQSLRDPLPGLVDIGRIAAAYRQRVAALLAERRFARAQQRAWRGRRLAAMVAAADSILFLCYGNINRSVLADAMLRGYAEDAGIVVKSAGFHPESGRPADPVMVQVAAAAGVDLGDARSRLVTRDMLRDSDVVFVMEKSHYDRVLALFDGAQGKVFLLGAHPGKEGWPAAIEDPYGGSREQYAACFRRIAGAVDVIKGMIAGRAGD